MSAPVRQSLASFRAERESDWRAFEDLLDRAEKRSHKALSEDELLALPVLYRATLSSLSLARATSLDKGLVSYLESLSLRGYFHLYGSPRETGRRIVRFFAEDWPVAVRDLWRETLVSFGLLVVGLIAGYRLVASDPIWFDAIIPPDLAGGRGPTASAAELREVLYSGGDFLGGFAAYLFIHNTQVAILAFALGFILAVPTVLLMLSNGVMIGAILQIYAAKGLGIEMGGWLTIHGSTELFAIVLAGAAGMRIGTRAIFPGEETRLAAFARAGRGAATAMVGVAAMLLCAGLLEGIGRQTILSDGLRYAIGSAMLALWLVYFYVIRVATDGRH